MSWLSSVNALLKTRAFKQQLDELSKSRKVRDKTVNNTRNGFKRATPEENRRRIGGSRGGAYWNRTNRNGTGPRKKGPGYPVM